MTVEPKIKNGKIQASGYNIFWIFDEILTIQDAYRKKSTILKMNKSTYDILTFEDKRSSEINSYKNHKVIIDNSLSYGGVVFCEGDADLRLLKEENNDR